MTNLTSGATSDLGAISAENGDDEVAWSPDGTRLAVENDSTVTLFVLHTESFTESVSLRAPNSCRLNSPAFLARRYEVAVISSCYGVAASHNDRIIAFDASNGSQVAVLATAPNGARFQGLSLDASGRYALLGIVRGDGAELARIDGTRLITISRSTVTDAEW
jgi:hypothetical protein